MDIRAKDYLVVDGQLYMAVVSDTIEQGRVLTWLRYLRDEKGMRKLDTVAADQYIREHYPQYIYHSVSADIELHGIPDADIQHVLKPQQAVQHLLHLDEPDSKQQDAILLLKLLTATGIMQQCLGLTGSLLLNAQGAQSDIDLIVYGRDVFFATRQVVANLVDSGELKPLQQDDWQDAYQRRDCSLDFDTYLWHEQRKLNKCIVGNSKVDITMLPTSTELLADEGVFIKQGQLQLSARVIDDHYAYDFPARYRIDHKDVQELVVFTATYVGQAFTGETIEASGMLEVSTTGKKRLVIGTSREATGEYLKVIESDQLISEVKHGTQQDQDIT